MEFFQQYILYFYKKKKKVCIYWTQKIEIQSSKFIPVIVTNICLLEVRKKKKQEKEKRRSRTLLFLTLIWTHHLVHSCTKNRALLGISPCA